MVDIEYSMDTYKSVPDCYRNHDMSNKAVHNYLHPLGFVPECYKIQKMYDKAFHTHPPAIKIVSKW